jgi:hypothetical protein
LIITTALTALIADCSSTEGDQERNEENMSSQEALSKAVEEVSPPTNTDDYGLLKRQDSALRWAEWEMVKKTERGEDWTP